jgi:hypothetical protein
MLAILLRWYWGEAGKRGCLQLKSKWWREVKEEEEEGYYV